MILIKKDTKKQFLETTFEDTECIIIYEDKKEDFHIYYCWSEWCFFIVHRKYHYTFYIEDDYTSIWKGLFRSERKLKKYEPIVKDAFRLFKEVFYISAGEIAIEVSKLPKSNPVTDDDIDLLLNNQIKL